jgi:prolyl 4-hydroxylase
LVKQVEDRARTFPAYKTIGSIKPMVVQKYVIAQQYRDHYDWFDDGPVIGGNIYSTFFVYIHANCTGGGTNFPRLKPPTDEKWCDFIDCDQPIDDGVSFKPITGNAIYWENLDKNHIGHRKTLHAGLPVTSGSKMGLNIWTWAPQ